MNCKVCFSLASGPALAHLIGAAQLRSPNSKRTLMSEYYMPVIFALHPSYEI